MASAFLITVCVVGLLVCAGWLILRAIRVVERAAWYQRWIHPLLQSDWRSPAEQERWDAASELFDASIRDLTKPLKRLDDDDPLLAARKPEQMSTCGSCGGGKTQPCPNALCGPRCELCMGYGRLPCANCHGLGRVAV